MPAQTKTIILVDGSSYLYRAFHALPALTNSKGFPTGAVYGVINMLRKLLTDYKPEQIAVIFDAKGKTFRDDLYTEYKATRKETPSDLVQQIEPIHRIIRAMGLPMYAIEGVEADDVIGTLADKATKEKINVIISTGDKDLAQLVNEHVTLINTMTNTVLNPQTVVEKFGVPPERIIDYLALIGDTSDNIPGVPSVGPKTAAKWLQQYGSLDEIIAKANTISGKVGEKLRAALPDIPLSKQLVTIKLDVDLPFGFEDLRVQTADEKILIEMFREYEFKNWLSELLESNRPSAQEASSNYEIITSELVLTKWLKKLASATSFGFALETSNSSFTADIVGIALALEPGKVAYIPIGHTYANAPNQLPKELVLAKLKPFLENYHKEKIGHNFKYMLEVLMFHGIHLQGNLHDIMLASYILDSTSNNHDINSQALKYLGIRTIPLEEITGKGVKQISLDQVDYLKCAAYVAENLDAALKLHKDLYSKLAKEPGIQSIYENIELPLMPVLARIESAGVLIDAKKLALQTAALQKRLIDLEKEAYAQAGKEFNINSPKQLQEILYDVLKLPVLQKTPTGQPSTADPVLQELAHDFALPVLIIEYRSISKLISTYTSKLADQINPLTGRIHTSYNQSATATGRLSSSDPNLQNIPVRTEEGRKIRQAFVASKGNKIISADYSQIELRLMAHISEDPNLLKAFTNNIDIHKATAAEVWSVPLDEVTSELRRNAKAINFGLIYGMSAFGLTRQLGIDRKSAQEYIEKYFTRYPSVREYMDSTRAQVKKSGYVETLWGRRLYLPDINASQIPRQRAAERAAINGPLQGSAADIIKLAMIRIDQWLRENNINATMIMQVHDELVFEAKAEEAEQIAAAIKKHMAEAVTLTVPLDVSVGIGDNWDAASAH